jgi:hypothetical protein
VNSTTITCTTPAHSGGSVDVVVTNSNGSGTLPNGFTYHYPPSLSSLNPDNGPTTGGTFVTLTGSDFTDLGTTSVTFGGSAASNVTVVSTTTITCTTPAHSAGTVDVEVTNLFGSDTLPNSYTYGSPPTVDSVVPNEGSVDGGTSVVITGSEFTNTADTTVTFGGTGATNVFVVNSTTISCDTPAHAAGAVDVVVTNSNGTGTLPNGFTYVENPEILNLDYTKVGNQIYLSWDLSAPGDGIIICRGSEAIGALGGSQTSFFYTENSFGYFRYTVCLFVDGVQVDADDVLVDFGKLTWTPPQQTVSGFYIYVAEAIGDPYQALPYNDPLNYSYDAGWCTELSLKALYDDVLIDGGKSYYIAASSYITSFPNNIVSDLTYPLTFAYEVVLETP